MKRNAIGTVCVLYSLQLIWLLKSSENRKKDCCFTGLKVCLVVVVEQEKKVFVWVSGEPLMTA